MSECTYTAEFAGGFRAELIVSRASARCTWTPEPPMWTLRGQRRRRFLAAYRAWRDSSLADFSKQTGTRVLVIDL